MTLTHLECFLAVAKLGSVNRAAEVMFLAQPTLTVRLQALENELGCQLFVRTKQGMKLTEAGHQFLPYAERSVANFEGGKQYLKELQAGREGDLRVGVLPRVSTYIVPPLLERFALSHPHVLISIYTGHSKYILEMVLKEEVQLVV